ncbi:MAG: GtrA family protein [Rikenellaceae bacterium]
MKLGVKSREIVRYAIVGFLATGIHYLMYFLVKMFLSPNLSYSIGFFIALVFNYFASSLFTFTTTLSFKKFLGFCLSHLVNYIIHVVMLDLVLRFGVNENIAPLPVFAVAIPINFILVRFFLKRGESD